MRVTPGNSKSLWLAPHVRACAIDGQVILLDLLRGRYLAVPECPSLSFDIGGWPACALPVRGASTDGNSVARSLRSQRLLVDHEVPNRLDVRLPIPEASIEQDRLAEGVVLNTIRLVSAASAAAISLRCRSLAAIASDVSANRRCVEREGSNIERLSTTYARLRPLVFSTRDHCLLDSLTLLRYLAHWKITPTWVIGVKTRPFAAHSWLQHSGTVLNDRHEHARQYRPILTA